VHRRRGRRLVAGTGDESMGRVEVSYIGGTPDQDETIAEDETRQCLRPRMDEWDDEAPGHAVLPKRLSPISVGQVCVQRERESWAKARKECMHLQVCVSAAQLCACPRDTCRKVTRKTRERETFITKLGEGRKR